MGRFKKRVVQKIVNLRKKNFVIQKLVAGILIVALLAGQAGTIDVFADTNTDAEAVDIRRVITSFEELPEAVREQSVPAGTEPEALVLPDTLEVSVQAVAENPEKVESPEVTESPTPTPTESPEVTESPTPTPTESPEATESPSAIPTESSEAAENPASTESPGNADNLIPTENPEETEEPENDTQTEDTGELEKETVTVALNEVYSSLSEESVMETLTISKTVTIEGVTWISMPEYEGEAAGEYIFTAVLPQGYVLAEGVCLPQIKVIVADGEQAVMTQISRWHFDEADVYPKGDLLCDEGSYSLVLAGGSSEVQIPLDEIISIFPESVTVEYADLNAGNNVIDESENADTEKILMNEEVLSIRGWNCPEYTEDEEGNLPCSGSFFFQALLGEEGDEKEYVFSEGTEPVGVWVTFDAPMLLSAVTAVPGTITSDQEWGEQTLAAGTYTIDPDVTVTVSGKLTVSGKVTITGGGKLVRADSYVGTSDSNGSYSTLIYVSGGSLTLENSTIDGNKVNACGPAVYMDSGTVTMNSGAVIQNNYNMNTGTGGGTYAAGGIYCGSYTTLNINGGKVQNCKTRGGTGSSSYNFAGGGIYLKGTCNMTSGSILNNYASNGGGIFLASTGATFNISGGNISGNTVSGAGKGIYYSTLTQTASKLYIGGNADIEDDIYLDNTKDGGLYPYITSKLNYKITLKCSSTDDGKVLGGGSGYTLTSVDASKISMADTGLYSVLDAANNKIILSTTEKQEAEWQETDGGEWKTGKFITALENVYSGGTIKLLKDIILAEKVEITKTVTITSKDSSKPYTITRMPSGEYGNITLTGSGSLTLLNGVTISGNTYSVYNDGKSVTVAGNSDLSGSIYTTNAISASGSGVSSLTKTYTILMSSVTNGTTVVTGSTDNIHYKLGSAAYALIPASGATNLIAAGSYTVTYNKNSGTIANESNYTSYTYGTGLTLPIPVRTGHTFGGWYEDADFTGSVVTKISKTDTENKNYYAKWTADKYTVTFDYQGATGGNNTANQEVAYNSTYGNLPMPVKSGYTFKGWYTQAGGGGSQIIDTTVVNTTAEHTLYAYWKDETAPDEPVLQSAVTLPAGWTNTQNTIPLTLNDGVGVTELYVSIDGSSYTNVSDFTSGSRQYFYAVTEGNHTYQFYAKDAAGNTSEVSSEFTIKLDTAKPVIGQLTYENKAANIGQWIIGKTSLLIHVPVTDEGSGVTQIIYTMTPVDADGNPDSSKLEKKTTSINSSGKATITFDKDFKGNINISCIDAAGNPSDSVTISSDGGGIIAEDNAPKISFTVDGNEISESYYDTAPDILVSITDDEDDMSSSMITGGINSVTCQIGSGTSKGDDNDYSTSMVKNSSFTILASEIPIGETRIIVTATDNAGNTASEHITVRVKDLEATPDAVISYMDETLTGLVANTEYKINNSVKTTDENGRIIIESSWLGTTIAIVKKGSNTTTLDSTAQSLDIPERPEAPMPELASCTDTRITLQTIANAQYRMENGVWQDSTTFSGLTPKTKYTFEAYYPATTSSFCSLAGNAVIATRPIVPGKDSAADLVIIDYEKEIFSISGGVEIFKDAACTQPINLNEENDVTDYIGDIIYIRYPADGDFPESAVTSIPIKSRPAVPVISYTDETYPGAGDGVITGLTEGTVYEISGDGGSTWTDVVLSGTQIKGLKPGNYQVRIKAGEENFQSEASSTVIIGSTPSIEETTPQAEISYADEALTGLTPGEKYKVSYITTGGTELTHECFADENGNIRFEEKWYGQTLEIVKSGNDKDKADSTPQSLTIPVRPAAPKPNVTGESSPGKNNGSISNLTPGEIYEISSDGGATWQDVTAGEDGQIKNLEPGSYEIREKAKGGSFSSESVTLKVEAYPGGSGDNDSGDNPEAGDKPATGDKPAAGDNPGAGDEPAAGDNSGTDNITGNIWKDIEKDEKAPDTEFSMAEDELAIVLTDVEKQPVKDSEPKTGDNMSLELYATVGMIAGLTYLLLYFGAGKCGMTEEKKRELTAKIIRWAHQGGRIRRILALAVIFLVLMYYHSIGKKVTVEWNKGYGE